MDRAILIFDGDCGMCNGFVAFLVRHDRGGRVLIAGSAGDVGRAALSAAGLDAEVAARTSVLWDGERAFTESDGLVQTLRRMPAPWRWLAAIRVVPRPWRDAAYRAVASRRGRLAVEGADPACGVPPRGLADRWRRRLATHADVAALARTEV